ncbi:putative receptor-activated Ca2 -permeable cation channel [Lyophyllum shimeji]|uniref:Receptor-activated Ca2 -permeable cation channel n=1 Tax=Lyophyllum shimeji TaxID=47721 RepID=A0A9P3URV8_LYOSH|nr:putative receptor-activated Ca2 -permeable cation channel [Lyophyllum shimeji]
MDHDYEHQGLLAPTPEFLATVKVFPLIPSLKKDVVKTIDSALSWEQLTASDVNFTIVRPIVHKYARLKNMAVVYACLVVRSYFLSESERDLANAGVVRSRATLCEILAMKLLTRFASNNIQLVAVLTTRWNPLAGATSEIVDQVSQAVGGTDAEMDSAQSALEMAISTRAKAFLAFPVTQKVVNDIHYGKIVFTMSGSRSILADNYKPRAIELYDCRKAPFLDHYRLRVPFYGAMLEFLNFALLLIAFVLCLSTQDKSAVTFWEVVFIIFAAAFTLEEYTAATEHGWILYIANLWNVFDFSFIAIFLVYLGLRIKGLHNGHLPSSDLAFDILACGACILFPRLAFFAVSNNVVILSLRAMVSQFLFFITIAAVCFSGLLFTLWTLGQDADPTPTLGSIAWLMTQIWFGNTSLSFRDASRFHPTFGPVLMLIFAALSNTLLLTILISLLSNTVARIDANATQEYLFQFAISTMEGVKSDALFSYQPPFNILAFVILKPATFILSPRALHSLNVFLIRLTSFPTLILIGIYERYFAAGQRFAETGREAAQTLFNSLPRHIKHMPLMEALVGSSSNDVYEAIFEVDVTSEIDPFEDSDEEGPFLRSFHSQENVGGGAAGQPGTPTTPRRRKRLAPSAGGAATPSPRASPRSKNLNLALPPMEPSQSAEPLLSAEQPASVNRSPLALFFSSRMPSADGHAAAVRAEATVKRVEAMMEDMRDLPVQKLKDEMKDLQDRQARIENLLLVLTRGMRNETPHRHDTLG